MKKSSLVLLLAMSVLFTHAQISLENNYPGSATLTKLSLSGYKYYLMDVVNNDCRIYNADHSLWKTIALGVPAGMSLYDVRYVSESLFNTDDKVELAYTYYEYDTTLYYYTYYSKVIDENGEELLSMPGCAFLEVKDGGEMGLKLLAYVYDYSFVNWTVNTLVYSLPGTLPFDVSELSEQSEVRPPFPNPATESVTIPYALPEGVDEAEIELFDGTGQMLRRYKIDKTFQEVYVAQNGLPEGIYFYQVISDKGLITAGKLIFK